MHTPMTSTLRRSDFAALAFCTSRQETLSACNDSIFNNVLKSLCEV